MSSHALRQFRLIQDGLELVVTPNKSGQSVFDDAVVKEELLSEKPSNYTLYGVCIPSPNYAEGDFKIVYKASSDLLQPLRIWQNTDYDFSLTVPHSRKEFIAQAKESSNPIYPFSSLELAGFLTFNSSFAYKETAVGYVLTGRFNFKEFSGLVNLDIETPRASMLFALEVMTSKLSYESDFIFLIEELSKLHSEIILNLDAPVSIGMDFDHERKISPHALLLHIRRLFKDDQLPCSVATILSNPNFRFQTEVEREIAAFVTKPCLTSLATKSFTHNWLKGGPLEDNFYGFTPETLPSRETKLHYNTVENQFVKAYLNRLSYTMESLAETLPSKYTTSHANLSRWHSQLVQWQSNSFWEGVSDITMAPNSMVLMGREGYREFYLSSLAFDLALKFETKSERVREGQLKPVWALYQLWCYFQLYDILETISATSSVPGLQAVFNQDLFNLAIKEGVKNAVAFTFKNSDQEEVTLKLYYNRTFTRAKLANEWSEVYSGFYHPDFSVEIIFNNRSHWIHFDAKYKLDVKQWEHELTTTNNGTVANGVSIKQEHPNLDKVHSYRDAILGTRGSYIIYPGRQRDPVVFVRHADSAYRKSHPGPSIGAFPLRPSRSHPSLILQKSNIENNIKSFLNQIYKKGGYSEEEGFY